MNKQEKAKWLSEFYAQVADGNDVEFSAYENEWLSSGDSGGPNLGSNPDHWRIKSNKKPIDLSVLMDSGIDCEFGGTDQFKRHTAGILQEITSNSYKCNGNWFSYCRPRMNHWHYWNGGECPLPDGFKVYVKFRRGDGIYKLQKHNSWEHNHDMNDIIAFRVISIDEENYCWPWDK